MGIPSFVKFLKYNIPFLYNTLEKLKLDVDNIFYDFNYLIHRAIQSKPIAGVIPTAEETQVIIEELSKMLVESVNMYKPRNIVYIAIQGSQPRAKLNHSRQLSNLNELDQLFDIKHKKTLLEKWKKEGKEVDEEITKFVNQQQTVDYMQCGTQFMHDVSEGIRNFIVKQMQGEWNNLKVVLNDEKTPGLVEYKIYDFIRGQRRSENYKVDSNNFVISSDSDLIMGAIPLCNTNIYISQNPVDNDNIISIKEIYEYIKSFTLHDVEKNQQIQDFIKEHNVHQRLYHDFVLIFLFIGNDFIPALPSLENKLRSMQYLMESYKTFLRYNKYNPIVAEDFHISLPNLYKFIHGLSVKQLDQLTNERKKMQEYLSTEAIQLEDKVNIKNKEVDRSKNTPLQNFNLDLDELYMNEPKKPFRHDTGLYLQDEERYNVLYYQDKFVNEKVDQQFVDDLTQNYLEGLVWNYEYLVRGILSWNWFFRYQYSPFPQDIEKAFQKFVIPSSSKGGQYSALVNLLAVHSSLGVREILPAEIQKLVTDSNISKYYPTDLKLDSLGKYYFKQSIVLNLPGNLNMEDIKSAVATQAGSFGPNQKALNTVSKNPRIYMGDAHGSEGGFEENDYKAFNCVGLFQRVSGDNGVHVFKFKYPSLSCEQISTQIQESEKQQLVKEQEIKGIIEQKKKEYTDNLAKTPCKYAGRCTNLQKGVCKFYHTEEEIANKDKIQTGPKPCTKGDNCAHFKQGKCKFYHPAK